MQPFGFMTSTGTRDSLAMYRTGNYFRLESDDELDAREIEQYELEGVEYTPDAEEAIEAVDEELAHDRVPRARADASQQVLGDRARRRDDAAEDDVLLSQAHLRPAPPSRF